METAEMPRTCKSTVYFKDGYWRVREPEQKIPRYLMAEQLTMAWVYTMNRFERFPF